MRMVHVALNWIRTIQITIETLCTELISIWLSDANPERVSDNLFAVRRTTIRNPFIQFRKTCDRCRCRIQWEKINRQTLRINRSRRCSPFCLFLFLRSFRFIAHSALRSQWIKWINNNNQWCAIPLFVCHIFKTLLIFIVHLGRRIHIYIGRARITCVLSTPNKSLQARVNSTQITLGPCCPYMFDMR